MKFKKDYKYLINNVLLFAISSFSTKIMSYIILPLYTSTVTETEYGIIDLVTVLINLLVPVLSICISDWVLRYVTENNDEAVEKFSISFIVIALSTALLIVIYPVLSRIDILNGYVGYLIIGYFFTAINLLFSYMVRAINKVRLISICSILSAVITIFLNLFWHSKDSLSINSYFICQYIGIGIGLLVFFVRGKLYLYLKPVKITRDICKEIISYCLPLIPNSLFWWMNSSIDKISVITLLSVASSGVYSAASKIPSLMTIFATIFQQAWNLTIFKKKEDGAQSFEEWMLVLYQGALLVGSLIIIVMSKFLASILLRGSFFSSWILIPILVVSFAFTTISTFIGSFFTAAKNTKPLFLSSLVAAVINISCNFILIKVIGLFGAAVATTISAFANYLYRIVIAKKNGYIKKTYLQFFCIEYLLIVFLATSYQYFCVIGIQIAIICLILSSLVGFMLRVRRNYK